MKCLGLDAAALTERHKRLHAGDAADVMEGRWRELWRRKTGRTGEADLSGEFRVQLGLMTEPFNLAWTQRMTGRRVVYFSANPLMRATWEALTGRPADPEELQVSAAYPFMACNLDGITTTAQGHSAVIDAKHVGRSDEAMILRYTAAGVHQATVMDVEWWGLSCIVGNKWEEPIFQEVDPFYQARLIAREHEFWGYVERDEEPPEEAAPVLPPKPQPRLRTIEVPLEEDEVFEALCRRDNWLPALLERFRTAARTYDAATAHNIAKAEMRELLPEDVGMVRRGLVSLARDKAGAVRWSIKKERANG